MSEPPAPVHTADPTSWQASLRLAYARHGERTVPVERRHHGPLRILKGLLPEGPALWHQTIVHPPGGIASGDRLSLDIELGEGAQALLTSPGAAKWYRCENGSASQTLRARIAPGASLEWLPLETILFRGTDARLDSRFDVEGDGRLIVADLCCLGRPASGEPFDAGRLHNRLQIRHDGRLCFHEQTRIEGARHDPAARAGFGGHPLVGMLLALAPEVDDGVVAACREAVARGEFGATRIDRLLIARWRGDAAGDGWAALRAAWAAIRPMLLKRPACAPRIWAT
ncbi:MAG TPA: urease accessory protein UreD [Burkholderiaceae bacterium]|nr:urease accessory protein UreD [Burkholderiaceae bacterium]